jgi:hypothetical protein
MRILRLSWQWCFKSKSCELRRRIVLWYDTDVSKDHAASTFRLWRHSFVVGYQRFRGPRCFHLQVVKPRSVVVEYQRFEGSCCLHLQVVTPCSVVVRYCFKGPWYPPTKLHNVTIQKTSNRNSRNIFYRSVNVQICRVWNKEGNSNFTFCFICV